MLNVCGSVVVEKDDVRVCWEGFEKLGVVTVGCEFGVKFAMIGRDGFGFRDSVSVVGVRFEVENRIDKVERGSCVILGTIGVGRRIMGVTGMVDEGVGMMRCLVGGFFIVRAFVLGFHGFVDGELVLAEASMVGDAVVVVEFGPDIALEYGATRDWRKLGS
jgi:hypothetical protein